MVLIAESKPLSRVPKPVGRFIHAEAPYGSLEKHQMAFRNGG